MKKAEVQDWLDRYLEAWRSYDPKAIRGLFAKNATYSYHPWEDQPLKGSKAIADSWLGSPDEPGSWEAQYRPAIVKGNRAFATGWTKYSNGRNFWNIFELEFDDEGRCTRFAEWFMQEPSPPPASST
ncbi:MAG TPA: nuclear transport factor 2 family protein [Acidimicrobiia bacterium]|jgi:hypothetical protein